MTKDNISPLHTIRKEDAIRAIKEIAANDTGRVFFTAHAETRMVERTVTRRQVLQVLRHGDVIQPPEWEVKQDRGWVCKLGRITAGSRLDVVAKIVEREPGALVLVITTFWRQ